MNLTEIVSTINNQLPLHNMWDSFWVHSFKRKTLVVSCSFDRIYYRDYDIVFKKVIFFNLPTQWRDTNIPGNDLIRIANEEEFLQHHLGFDASGFSIFAIDMYFGNNGTAEKHSFFIIAKHIYLNKCDAANNNPSPNYTDPFAKDIFPSKMNRVL